MNRLVLIDGNNWGFAGMANPTLSAGEKDTQAVFSIIKRIRGIYESYDPNTFIMVLWDRRSWRKDFFTEYKANRVKTEKQVAAKNAYAEQSKDIVQGLQYLGVTQVSAKNMEADDLAYIITKNAVAKGSRVTLLTADHDWQQLVQPNVNWINVIHDQSCRIESFKRDTSSKDHDGFNDPAQFVEAKCVLGDAGDNIKGVHGIGPKALQNLYTIYPTFQSFLYELDVYGHDFVGGVWKERIGKLMPKALRELDIAATRAQMDRNMTLMDLATPNRPAPVGLVREYTPLNEEAFKQFCIANSFRSILRDFDEFILPFKENQYVSR